MLIHPNGCIFFGGGLLWGLYALTTRHPRIQRYEWYVMACGVAMLVAYVHFVVLNWAGFVQDMTWQFQFKGMATQQSWQSLLLGSKMQLFAIYSVLLALTLFLRKRTHLTFIGYLFLATWILRGQMWYELFLSLSVCIGIIETINLAKVVLTRFSLPRTPRICLCGAFCLVLMLWAYREGYLPGPKGYPDDLTWGWGMSVSKPEAPYITKKDIQHIGNEINRLNKNHALTHVQFYPAAESLFFLTGKESFTPIQPIFSSMRPDIAVFHHSPDIPHWLKIEKEEKRWLHRPQRIIQSACNSNSIWVIYH
jgi:hypothetical protein